MGIHPEETEAEEFAAQLREEGLYVIACDRHDDRFRFPKIDDLAGYLSRQPGSPDLRLPEYRELLLKHAEAFSSFEGGYIVPRPYLVWVART